MKGIYKIILVADTFVLGGGGRGDC